MHKAAEVLLPHKWESLIPRDKENKQTWKYIYLMHALQALIANFEPLNDLHLNLHELNILNLLANILAWESYILRCQTKTHSFAHNFHNNT